MIESTAIACVSNKSRLQAFHASMVSKSASAFLGCVGAALLQIVAPAQGLVVARLRVQASQFRWDLSWSFSTLFGFLGGGGAGRSGP